MANQPSVMRQALLDPLHLGFLAFFIVFLLVMPFPFWLELLTLAVVEVIFLFGVARSPAYARRLRLKAGQAALESKEQAIEQRALELRRDDRRRFNELTRVYQDVRKRLEDASAQANLPIGMDVERLQELREAALEFCLTSQRFREHLGKTDPQTLKAELQGPAPSDPTALTAWGLKQQRLEILLQMQTQQATLEHQLGVIEQTFQLLKEQLSSLSAQALAPLGQQVGQLSTDVEATRRTLREMAVFERALG